MFIKTFIEFFLHIDKNLLVLSQEYGVLMYGILFFIIFMETGLVVTPFLPGDSLLFAAGALAASLNVFDIKLLWILILVAAFLGDTVNYWIGHFIGEKAFTSKSRFLKKKYLDNAQSFYDKYGGKAIILARFVPIVRTFAPFVAGIGKMHYGKFLSFNAVGGFLWVSLMLFTGYFFGNIEFVKTNFHYVVLMIIFISVIPIGVEVLKHKLQQKDK